MENQDQKRINGLHRSLLRAFDRLFIYFPTKKIIKPPEKKLLLSTGLFLIAIGLFFGYESSKGCLMADSDILPTDYCFVSHFNVANTGSSEAVQGYAPIRVEFPYIYWKQKDFIDKSHSSDYDTAKLWDIKGFAGTIEDTFEIIGSDIRNSGTGLHYLWVIPETTALGSNNFSFYHGNEFQKRDQSIYFFDEDSYAFAVDHNDLDLTGNDWNIRLRVAFIPSKLTDGALLVSKYNEDTDEGWKIEVNKTSGGDIEFVCHTDLYSLTTSENISSSIEKTSIHQIDFYKTSTGAVNCLIDGSGDLGVVPSTVTTSTTEQLKMGTNLNNTWLYDLKIWDGTTPVVSYLFNPSEISFNSEVGDDYAFTIENTISSSHPVSYNLHSDQSFYEVVIENAVSLFEEDVPSPVSLELKSSLEDELFGADFYETPDSSLDKNSLQTLLDTESDYIPSNLVYSMIFVAVGLSFGALGFVFSKSVMFASVLTGVPVVMAVSLNFLPTWYLFFYAMLLIFSFGMKEFAR